MMSSRGFISLTFTAPSLTLTLVLRISAFDYFALFWHPASGNSTRICKACLVVAINDDQGIDMEYDGLLFCQGLRAKASEQPQRWIRYEAYEKSHGRDRTLLYGERRHCRWSANSSNRGAFGGNGTPIQADADTSSQVVGAMDRLQPPAPTEKRTESAGSTVIPAQQPIL